MNRLFWRFTQNDLKTKLRLFMGQKQAQAVQDFQNLSLVASQLFGGSKASEKTNIPKNKQEMLSAFSQVFSQ